MLWRFKRFFSRGFESRKQPLPPYALLYFDNLHGEYGSLPLSRVPEEDQEKVAQLLGKRKSGDLAWNDIYSFDLIMARLQPVEKLPRMVWSLRNRYREVAGLREYDAYMASKPPEDNGATPDEKALRADIEYLLGALHLRYSVRPVREQARDWLSRAVAYITLAGLIWVILCIVLVNIQGKLPLIDKDVPTEATAFLVVIFLGAMGGLVSMQQRFQSASDEGDPIQNVSELAHGWFSLFLAPLSGAVFAAVIFLCFIGGLLEGELFPEINFPTQDRLSIAGFLRTAGPAAGGEYAKLMVWAFIAGFAERLVPDTLSRFVAKKAEGDGTAAPAAG